MTAKTTAQRRKESDDRKREAGYVKKTVWVPKVNEKGFTQYVEKLSEDFEATKD